MIRSGKGRYTFVTLLPLTWLVGVTMTAGIEKIFSAKPNIGFLSHAAKLAAEMTAPATTAARALEIDRHIWNDRVDAALTAFFIIVVIIVLGDSIRVWSKLILRAPERAMHEEAA
jgi:carbon starvation protein